jgi:hypothetical protein
VIELNRLIGLVEQHPSLSQLILLGYVSAVESYFRQLFCSIIFIDKGARTACYPQELSYGAALAQIENPKLLGEALLEKHSFISKKNVRTVMKDFLGFKSSLPNELATSLDAFGEVCQIRNCAVHRFGRLGSKNAIALGMDSHQDFIECPLSLMQTDLLTITAVCTNVVKVTNNTLFNFLLQRTVEEHFVDWQWDWRNDKKEFKKYYHLFYSEKFSTDEKFTLKSVYETFKSNYDR